MRFLLLSCLLLGAVSLSPPSHATPGMALEFEVAHLRSDSGAALMSAAVPAPAAAHAPCKQESSSRTQASRPSKAAKTERWAVLARLGRSARGVTRALSPRGKKRVLTDMEREDGGVRRMPTSTSSM